MLKKISFDSLSGKVTLILLLNFLIIATVALVGYSSLNRANDSAIEIHDTMSLPARHLSDSFRLQIISHIQFTEAAQLTGQARSERLEFSTKLRNISSAGFDTFIGNGYPKDVEGLVAQYKGTRQKYMLGYENLIAAVSRDAEPAEISRIIEQYVRPHGVSLGQQVDVILKAFDRLVQQHHEQGLKSHDSVIIILVLIGTVGLACTTLLGIAALRSMNNSINLAQSALTDLARGLFDKPIKMKGPREISGLLKSMESMRALLNDTIVNISNNTGYVQDAAKQMSMGNSDLAKRTQEQATSLEETTAAMGAMTKTVRQNALDAKEASRLADQASNRATESGEVVDRTVDAMSELNSSSAKVVDIVSLIDEISFQTNLLALNAAVEAARAGEQGRGFAVVASEVRNLAQRSAAAAQEIKVLIEDSSNKVKISSNLVNESGIALRDILEGIGEVTALNSRIAKASDEQANGIEEVNTSMAEMERVTQANAALVEQAAITSEELDSRAGELEHQVEFFHSMDKGVKSGASAGGFSSRVTALAG